MSSTEELKKRRLEAADITTDGDVKVDRDRSKKVKILKEQQVQDDQQVVQDENQLPVPAAVAKLKLNSRLQDPELVKELKTKWGTASYDSTEKPMITMGTVPFTYCEFHDILADSSILHELQETLEYEEKSSDLFHFHQSCDLNSLASEAEGFQPVQAIKDFFQQDLFNLIKSITDLPLNGKFDIFASQYEFNDHLLCHDDELDSRRIAFIIYMTEGWKAEFGGTLDLFDCSESASDSPQPGSIVRSLCPEFNKLVFFEVTAKSFHQVSEVVKKEGDCRRAISGWFYGDALPRPPIQLPVDNFANVNFMDRSEIPLDEYLDDSYLNSENLKVVNEKLSENSEILLSNFFKSDVFPSIAKDLECVDDDEWTSVGPANLQNYHVLENKVPETLLTFFKSKTFLEFLQELTEFPFASEPELRFTLSLKKFKRGSYTLVRGKDRSYKIKNLASATSGIDRRVTPLSDSEESVAGSDSVGDVETLKDEQANITNGNGASEIKTNGNSSKPEKPVASGGHSENGNEEPGDDSDGDGAEDAGSGSDDEEIMWEAEDGVGSDEEEEAEEPNRVDVMFFIVPPASTVATQSSSEVDNDVGEKELTNTKWDESWGGCRIYTDDLTGNALINLTPANNSLAIVVRDESISSHYSYVNCLAQNRVFYSYDFEFNFPRASTATAAVL